MGGSVMTTIILGNKDQINFHSALYDVAYLDFMGDAKESDKLIFASATDYNLSAIDLETQEVYIPAHKLNENMDTSNNTYVYFDLENYPFFQAAQAIIKREEKPKGVLRYRRTVEESVGEAFFVSDFCVLTSLLGEPEDIKVRRTNASVMPVHMIALVDFGVVRWHILNIRFLIKRALNWSGAGLAILLILIVMI